MESCSQEDHEFLTYGRTSSEMNIPKQCFSTMDEFTSKGTLGNVWGHVLMLTPRVGMLLAYGGQRPGVLLNNPQCMGQPHRKGSSGTNPSSADIEKPFSRRKEASVGSQSTRFLSKMFRHF